MKPTTTQKDLKEKYMQIIREEVWKGSSSMQKYAEKNAAYIVPLANGDITDIDKPRIETSFCFGYGQNGVSTEEDYRAAADTMKYADTHKEYFMKENLKGIDEMITDLSDPNTKVYKHLHYCGQESGSKLKGITLAGWAHSAEYEPWRYSNLKDFEEVSQEERNALITGYQEVRKAFEKRLHTYLKRYGLSKLKTWTYLVD